MYRTYIELSSDGEIEEFTEICSKIPIEVTVRGKDENGSEWMLSAISHSNKKYPGDLINTILQYLWL